MTSAADRRRERGEVTATVLMIPAIILTALFVVQFALAYYARSVLAGAAHDGATAGARRGSTAAAGAATIAKSRPAAELLKTKVFALKV